MGLSLRKKPRWATTTDGAAAGGNNATTGYSPPRHHYHDNCVPFGSAVTTGSAGHMNSPRAGHAIDEACADTRGRSPATGTTALQRWQGSISHQANSSARRSTPIRNNGAPGKKGPMRLSLLSLGHAAAARHRTQAAAATPAATAGEARQLACGMARCAATWRRSPHWACARSRGLALSFCEHRSFGTE